jgi:hypothetical protein
MNLKEPTRRKNNLGMSNRSEYRLGEDRIPLRKAIIKTLINHGKDTYGEAEALRHIAKLRAQGKIESWSQKKI